MNKEVSFELAKLLKEKGFEKNTNKYYVQVFENTFKLTHHKIWKMDEESGFQNTPHYAAPTIAEIVMWLYEKHGIWIVVNFANKNQWYFDCNKFGFDGKDKKMFQSNYNFNSPTEAYEVAIEYILNNLL